MKRLVWLALSAGLAAPAIACDVVEYAEAKTWSDAKLKQQYCADLTEAYEGVKASLNAGARFDRRQADRCEQQMALYKRLIEARNKELSKCSQ